MKKFFTIIIALLISSTLFGVGCTNIKQKESTNIETSTNNIQKNQINEPSPNTTTSTIQEEEEKEEVVIEQKKILEKQETKTATETPTKNTNNTKTETKKKSDDIKIEEVKIDTKTPTTTEEKITICNSMDCLTEQAKACTKSELIYNISSKMPVDEDTYYLKIERTYLKMKKVNDNTCQLTSQPLSVTITLPKESKEKALEKGFTEEDINWDLDMVNRVENEPMQLNHITSCVGTNEAMYSYFVGNQEINNKNCYATNSEIICNYGGITCTLSDIR